MKKPSRTPPAELEEQMSAAADRLERVERGLRARESGSPSGEVPPEFKANNTGLLHELRLLRGDIVKMREEAAQVRAATLSRTEFEARSRRLLMGGVAAFIVLALALATFLLFQSRNNSQIARFEARSRQFQQEAITACKQRNSRIQNEQVFRDNVLKILATGAATQARDPKTSRAYATAIASYRRGFESTVDCAKQSKALSFG